jgi:hypothetical protein
MREKFRYPFIKGLISPLIPVISIQIDKYHPSDEYIIIPLVILMFRKKDGGISVVAKKRSAIGTFF